MGIRRHQAGLIIILLFFIHAAGCELLSGRLITLCLPDFPGRVAEDLSAVGSWQIEYPEKTEAGLPVYTTCIVPAEAASGSAEISIRIARGVNLPVLARPLFGFGRGGYPAGAVYPVDAAAGRLELYWENGFACEVLKSCMLNSAVVQGFDTAAFRESIAEKASGLEAPGGCWLLDPGPVISRLGYGLFRESSLKAADTINFAVPVSGGTYVADNPFYPPVTVQAYGPPENRVLHVTVPKNRRTAFHEPDTGETVTICFNDRIWCWTNSVTGLTESGRM